MSTLWVATSPRSTWITAPDAKSADDVRRLLAGRYREVSRGGETDSLTIDVGIGVAAMEAGDALLTAGHSFRWHDDQHVLDRSSSAWGIPVEES